MGANQYGIDLAGAYKSIESIKSARSQNRLSALKVDKAEAEPARLEALDVARRNAVFGDEAARREYLALDPKGGPVIDAISKMDETNAKQAQSLADEAGSMYATILQAPLEKQEMLYQEMLLQTPEEFRGEMPPNFDRNKALLSFAKYRALDKVLETKVMSYGGQDVMTKGGLEVGRVNKPVKPSASIGNKPLTQAQTNTEYARKYRRVESGIASLAGAKFGPDGQYILPGKRAAEWVQVQNEAMTLMDSNPKMKESEATIKAAIKVGLIEPSQWKDFKKVVDSAGNNKQGGSQTSSSPAGNSRYQEGQQAKDANGNTLTFTNGKWVAQ